MKIRKAIKKIVALGMGASLIGATVMAAGLNAYPQPFVQSGKFAGTLVVGDNAAAEDVVGVSDIAMSLQFAASVKAGTGAASTVAVEGDVYHFKTGGDALNLYQELSGIRSVITDEDLNALADGTFRGKSTESYTQRINSPSNATIVWDQDDEHGEDPQVFLKFLSNKEAINYQLNFGTAPASDVDSNDKLEDFEDNKISLMGKEYTVTKAENKSGGVELTLMSGAVQDTLEVGQTKTYTINGQDYEVTVMIVSGDTSATGLTKFIINDEVTPSLSNDETYTLKDGTEIGIKEVLPTKSGDVVQNLVEFFLGAEKVVFDGVNNELDIGDNTALDDTVANVTTSTSSGDIKLDRLDIALSPTTNIFIPVGGTFSESAALEDESDYVDLLEKLGIDYEFSGFAATNKEEVKIIRNDDNAMKMSFTNKNSIDYNVPILYTNSSGFIYLGEEFGKDLIVNESSTIQVCDENYFVVENDEQSRVLQLTNIKNGTDNKYVKIKDVGTGDSTQYDFDSSTGVADMNIDGYTYQVTVVGGASPSCVNPTDITDDSDGKSDIWTKYGTKIELFGSMARESGSSILNDSGLNNLVFTEDDDLQEDDNSQDSFAFNFTYESANTNIDFQGSVKEPTNFELSMLTLDSDSDKSQGYTKWGTYLERDASGDQDDWMIIIPENELEGQVFLTAGTTSITQSDEVTGEAVILQKIDVGATKLASEVAGLETSQNVILVGGPCANAAVESTSDEFPTCSGWPYSAGEAIIQLVEHTNGNVALLVAGTTAADTRMATGVVADMALLKGLGDGVTKQLVTIVQGTEFLSNVPEVEVVADESEEAEEAPEEDAEDAGDAEDAQ